MPARSDPHDPAPEPPDRDPELPLDSDLGTEDVVGPAAATLHRRPRFLLLVAAGGAIGTGLREALSLAFPLVSGISLTTGAINVVGAFLLALLMEVLTRSGPDTGRLRDLRLFVGTGVLGGFTTYSALAADAVVLGDAGRFIAAGGYAVGTLVFGLAAAALGIAVGRRATGDPHRRAAR